MRAFMLGGRSQEARLLRGDTPEAPPDTWTRQRFHIILALQATNRRRAAFAAVKSPRIPPFSETSLNFTRIVM